MDTLLRDDRSSYRNIVMHNNILFYNDPVYGPDPDAKLKLCIILLVAAVNENDQGGQF